MRFSCNSESAGDFLTKKQPNLIRRDATEKLPALCTPPIPVRAKSAPMYEQWRLCFSDQSSRRAASNRESYGSSMIGLTPKLIAPWIECTVFVVSTYLPWPLGGA